MKNCRITVMRKASYPDLSEKYENFLETPCDMETGSVFVSVNGEKPEGLCQSAWETMESFVKGLYGEIKFTDYCPFPLNPINGTNDVY